MNIHELSTAHVTTLVKVGSVATPTYELSQSLIFYFFYLFRENEHEWGEGKGRGRKNSKQPPS